MNRDDYLRLSQYGSYLLWGLESLLLIVALILSLSLGKNTGTRLLIVSGIILKLSVTVMSFFINTLVQTALQADPTRDSIVVSTWIHFFFRFCSLIALSLIVVGGVILLWQNTRLQDQEKERNCDHMADESTWIKPPKSGPRAR